MDLTLFMKATSRFYSFYFEKLKGDYEEDHLGLKYCRSPRRNKGPLPFIQRGTPKYIEKGSSLAKDVLKQLFGRVKKEKKKKLFKQQFRQFYNLLERGRPPDTFLTTMRLLFWAGEKGNLGQCDNISEKNPNFKILAPEFLGHK